MKMEPLSPQAGSPLGAFSCLAGLGSGAYVVARVDGGFTKMLLLTVEARPGAVHDGQRFFGSIRCFPASEFDLRMRTRFGALNNGVAVRDQSY